jgi:beta-lactamase class A
VRHAPSHAGKLPAWERLVFATIFALMTAFVVAVTMSAVKRGGLPGAGGKSPAASSATGRLQPVTAGGQHDTTRSSAKSRTGSAGSLDQRLAVALSPLLGPDGGHFAVGVINISTGARAVFNGARPFRAAGLEKVDILAALLLEHQQAGTLVTSQQAALAVSMIENSSEEAATDLYQAVGGLVGMTSANEQLGLNQTVMGPPGQSGLTKTTVSDQLQLLADLTAKTSVLSPASQEYELDLMARVQVGQRWGASAAATPGTSYSIKDGWLADPETWVTNSMGVVDHGGQRLLIVVLASGQRSEAVGIALDAAVAANAARIATDS